MAKFVKVHALVDQVSNSVEEQYINLDLVKRIRKEDNVYSIEFDEGHIVLTPSLPEGIL